MSPFHRDIAKRALRIVIFLAGMTCLCLVAIQPFTLRQMPYSADGLLQLHRTVALEHSLRVDHPFWPRFSSGLVYGYGAPLFNFFPPLAYYPASLLHNLGLSFLAAWLLSMSAYTVLAGAGMFFLGRLWTRSELGGWMAAAAYVYSPYLLFDSVTRGATAELAALAALPFAFYGLTRLAFAGRRRDFLIALGSVVIFIPLHTIVTLLGGALLALYCLLLAWRADDGWRVLLRLALAGALALLLTAFYWLPALLETAVIKLPLITEQLGHIDVTRHLRSLSEVLAHPQTADPTQQNRALPIALGWPQLLLAAIGALLSWPTRYRPYRSLMIALWLAVGFFVFLNTRASAWLWQNIPLIGFSQFPWRTLGLASLLLALLAAAGARLLWLSLDERRGKLVVISLFPAMLLLYALPWTYTLYRDDVYPQDIRDAQAFERSGGQLSLSSYAEYLPVSADASQLDAERLIARFEASDAIERLLPSATLEIVEARWGGTAAALRLRSAEAQTLVFDWLYLPGWSAAIDGAPVAVFPSAPAGLLALEAPAGEFELRLSLRPTAAQSLANGLSALGLGAALLALLFWRARAPAANHERCERETERRWLLIFAAIGCALFLLKAIILDAADTPAKRSRFGEAGAAEALANFGGAIDLIAVEAPREVIRQPTATFKLYWRLRDAPLEPDYSSVIRMRDPQGMVVAQASSFMPGGIATSNWLPGAYIEDRIELELPPFTPLLPEAYSVEISLYDSQSLRALSLINAAGDPQDVKYTIGALPLRLSDADFEARNILPLPAERAEALASLIEAPALPAEATAGDVLELSWVWQKLRASDHDVMARLIWIDEGGEEVAAAVLPLVKGYDFAAWRIGEANRGHHQLVVPASLQAGRYGLGISPLDAEGRPLGDMIPLNSAMTVAVPQREFEAPPFDTEARAEWANGIVLHGFSLDATGAVDLVWGTRRQLLESLHLFAQALDDKGRIAGQWDGVPADWTRHTTSWLAGEYITTSHFFALPAGEYQLRLGWYAPHSGERVKIGETDQLLLEPALAIE